MDSQYITSHLLGQVLSTECPSRTLLEHLANKWTILVLRCLSEGVHRFSELKNRIEGVSEKMLSQTLKTLESDGFILRTVYPVVPPKVEYQLTILGSQVTHKVMELVSWIERNLNEIMENKERIQPN